MQFTQQPQICGVICDDWWHILNLTFVLDLLYCTCSYKSTLLLKKINKNSCVHHTLLAVVPSFLCVHLLRLRLAANHRRGRGLSRVLMESPLCLPVFSAAGFAHRSGSPAD